LEKNVRGDIKHLSKIRKMRLNKNEKNKTKKVYSEEQVIGFSELAEKYQKKLDLLLSKEAGIRQVNAVLDDYNEEVENIFLVDDDNQDHRIIALDKGKKLSPYVLDLSSISKLKGNVANRDWQDYKKREEKVLKLEKSLKAVRVSRRGGAKISQKALIKALGPKAEEAERKANKKFEEEQFIVYSSWRYRWLKFYGTLNSLIKGLALLLLFVFSVVILFLVNLQDISKAASLGQEGIYNLDSIKEDLLQQDWQSVEDKLRASGRSFIQAHARLQEVNPVSLAIIKMIPPINRKYVAVDNLLNAAVNLDLAGIRFVELIRNIFTEQGDRSMDLLIEDYLDNLSGIAVSVEQGNNYLQKINILEIPEYASQIKQLQMYVPLLTQINQQLLTNRAAILDALGHEHQRRYLVVFQNNKELRPTGGFMGSMALVDIDRGQIKNIEVPGGGLYDYKGGLTQYIAPPEPLQVLQSRWFFHDSNWFSDFPNAAKKILWFFEASGGSSVDGLITVNFTVLEDLLHNIGEIKLEKDGQVLDASNIWYELQKAVELDYDKEENKPKQIVGDLLFQLQEKILTGDTAIKEKFFKVLLRNLWHKEILLYSNNEQIENLIRAYNFAGEIFQTDKENYLMIVNANLGGNKSDAVLRQHVDHQTVVEDDGSIVCSLNIKRKNTAQANQAFLTGPNVVYMQIYVPQGSELLSAYGFSDMPAEKYKTIEDYTKEDVDLALLYESAQANDLGMSIHDEFGKTVFANWVSTAAGEEVELNLIYRLPFKIQDLAIAKGSYAYSLLVQKQSGDIYTDLEHSFVLPQQWQVSNAYPLGSNNGYSVSLTNDYQMDFIIADK